MSTTAAVSIAVRIYVGKGLWMLCSLGIRSLKASTERLSERLSAIIDSAVDLSASDIARHWWSTAVLRYRTRNALLRNTTKRKTTTEMLPSVAPLV